MTSSATVGLLNGVAEGVRASLPVRIIDATLREGMQAPGVRFDASQSADIAALLVQLGVDVVECGQPSASEEERARIRAVWMAIAGASELLCHARADERDIEAAAAVGAGWVGIFLGINDISLSARVPGWTRNKALRRIADCVRFATGAGLKVRFTIEDASRTSPEATEEAYRVALQSGASRICFADTVGVLSPIEVSSRVTAIAAAFPDIQIEVHLHDDRGLALANALAALQAGATWVSTSVNGLGERCGIIDLCALIANLDFMGLRSITNPELLPELSSRVAAYTRSPVDDRRPVTGRNAFTHTGRLHRLAQRRDRRAYEWMAPERVGRSHTYCERLPCWQVDALITAGHAIAATELRHHRAGPGVRWVMVDERFVPDSRQYCIVRRIPHLAEYGPGHVDVHAHRCDSLFVFIGEGEDLEGLTAEVTVNGATRIVHSLASVFIPAGATHSYRIVSGAGLFLNHVLSGSYEASLLDIADSSLLQLTSPPL